MSFYIKSFRRENTGAKKHLQSYTWKKENNHELSDISIYISYFYFCQFHFPHGCKSLLHSLLFQRLYDLFSCFNDPMISSLIFQRLLCPLVFYFRDSMIFFLFCFRDPMILSLMFHRLLCPFFFYFRDSMIFSVLFQRPNDPFSNVSETLMPFWFLFQRLNDLRLH